VTVGWGGVPTDQPSIGDEPGEAKAGKAGRPDRFIPDLDSMSTAALESAFGSDRPPSKAPSEMPVNEDGKPAVESAGYRAWYRDHGADNGDAPAPADRTPMREMERRGADPPVAGVLTREADRVLEEAERVWEGLSGREGPAERVGWEDLRLPNGKLRAQTHVEAHAAGAMHEQQLDEAVLYLSRLPCPYDRLPAGADRAAYWASCDTLLPRMLPAGSKLTVYGPEGWWKVYRGTTEGEG